MTEKEFLAALVNSFRPSSTRDQNLPKGSAEEIVAAYTKQIREESNEQKPTSTT